MQRLKLVVRDARESDIPTIVEFNRLLALESEGKRLDVEVLRQGVARAIALPQYCRYFVAESDSRVIGQTMITYEWSDWRNGLFWWLQSVYVAAPERSRGVFRALFEHVERQARLEPGVCGLRLYVEEHNARALEAYRKLGMQPSGHLLFESDWSARPSP